eukprot:scaffold3682_cov30-Tisochrysis_lutea.AAC.2
MRQLAAGIRSSTRIVANAIGVTNLGWQNPSGFNGEDEVIADPGQFDAVIPFGFTNAFTAHGARARACRDSSDNSSKIFYVENAHWTLGHKLVRGVARHLLLEGDFWKQPVRRGCNRGPLCMGLSRTLLAPSLERYGLSRTQLCDQDVIVDRTDGRIPEPLFLVSLRDPLKRPGQHSRIDHLSLYSTSVARPAFSARSSSSLILRSLTLHFKPKSDHVMLIGILISDTLAKHARIGFDWDEAEAVGKYLVLSHGGVVQHEDLCRTPGT